MNTRHPLNIPIQIVQNKEYISNEYDQVLDYTLKNIKFFENYAFKSSFKMQGYHVSNLIFNNSFEELFKEKKKIR